MVPSQGIIFGLSFLAVVIAFAFAAYLYLWIKRQPVEIRTIRDVSGLIKAGANTFMRKEYKILAAFAGGLGVLILLFLPRPIWTGDWVSNVGMALAYVAGTVLSAIAGKIGIMVATHSNSRAAEGAREGIKPAILIGFRGGAVLGLQVV